MGFFKIFENIVKCINESINTDGWVCVGEAPGYFPWSGEGNKTYIMVNPQKEMKGGRMVNKVLYTENPDGSGKHRAKLIIMVFRIYNDFITVK